MWKYFTETRTLTVNKWKYLKVLNNNTCENTLQKQEHLLWTWKHFIETRTLKFHKFRSAHMTTTQHINGAEQLCTEDSLNIFTWWPPEWRLEPELKALQTERSN